MTSLLAAAVFLVILLGLVEMLYSAYSLPLFKDACPEEFIACDSPSIIPIGNGVFLAFLLGNKHKILADPAIVRILDRHKWIMVAWILSIGILAVTLVATLAA